MPTEESFFFIDANRAYRGPVSKATLSSLLQTKAITTSTYIFADHLVECEGSWVRLKRLPKLLEELQPLPGSLRSSDDALAGSAAPSSAAAAPSSEPACSSAPAAADAPASDAVPRLKINPTAEAGAETSAPSPRWSATQGGTTAEAAERLSQVAPTPRERLSTYFAAATPRESTGSSSSRRGSGGFLFFGRSKASAASKGAFGRPLSAVALDAEGVPEVLAKLRTLLFGLNGHLVEGIFRVSPATSTLKQARADADSNKLDRVRDTESIAQLIKLYFRGLPESIFAPRLEPIVDGPPEDGASCSAIIDGLPQPQRSTVRWLLQLFRDVAMHEAQNRMTIKSLSVVFAPNLVDPPPTMPPMLALELNGRVVTFLERLFEYEARREPAVDVS